MSDAESTGPRAPVAAYAPPAATPEAPGWPVAPPPGQSFVPTGAPYAIPSAPGYGELAGWGRRAAAVMMDYLFTWVPIAAVVGIVAAASAASHAAAVVTGIVLGLVSLVYWFLGRSLLMARKGDRNGQTWGKQIMGIRAARDGGEPFDLGWSLLRQVAVKGLLFSWIGGTLFIPWLLDFLWPLWDDSSRALHDLVVSTHVVRA